MREGEYEDFFVADRCRFKYFNSLEANTCLASKQLLFVGDSILEEVAGELFALLEMQEGGGPVNTTTWRNPTSSQESVQKECREMRLSYMARPNGFNGCFCWSGHPWVTRNAEGLLSYRNSEFRDRVKMCSSNPEAALRFDCPSNQFDPVDQHQEGRKADILVVNSFFHDMAAGKLTWVDHVNMWPEVYEYLSNHTQKLILMTANPKFDAMNYMIRTVNRRVSEQLHRHIRSELAATFDVHDIQTTRPEGVGDSTHASKLFLTGRTRYAHTSMQYLLNILCN